MALIIEYFDVVTGESVGDLLTSYSSGEPECPKCQRPMEYEEFTTGSNAYGQDEWFCSHTCHGCMICTREAAIDRPSE